MKKFFSFILALCLLCPLLPGVSAADDSGMCGDGVTWSYYGRVLTISGSGDMQDFRDTAGSTNVAPWASHLGSINSIVVEEGVTSIGDNAFKGLYLTRKVSLPDSLTRIGKSAFYKVSRLSDIQIPQSVTSIGERAFAECIQLNDVVIPEGITTLEKSVFDGCKELSRVTLPQSLTSIGDRAFSQTRINTVDIPENVTSIGDYAFDDTALRTLDIPKSVTSIGDYAFSSTLLANVTIPKTVTSIGEGAFNSGTNFTGITLPDNLTSIPASMLSYCENFKTIAIPQSVTSIGSSAFARTGLTSIIIPDSVETIGVGAFFECMSLQSVVLPGNLACIEEQMFHGCTRLSRITIPQSVTQIYAGAFEGCTGLTDIYYGGTREQWDAIEVYDYLPGVDNSCLKKATVHCLGSDLSPSSIFSDVHPSSPYRQSIDWALTNNITNGTSASAFSPNATCTSAQILTFLHRSQGSPAPASSDRFSGAPEAYKAALNWAFEQGLIDAGADYNADCTRAAAVTYLWKLAGAPALGGAGFSDVPSNAGYAQAVAWAVAGGVTNGTSDTTFSPQQTCTRGQIVTFLFRAYQ